MIDPTLVSLDIETYSICAVNALGEPLPEQRHFHPIRCLTQDRVTVRDLVISCALTVPKSPVTTCSTGEPTAEALASMEPGDTMFLLMHEQHHRARLYQWLTHADILMGFNITFDILMLRSAGFRPFLNNRHLLIDTQILNYLSNEQRVERSLKTIGPVLGTHSYDEESTAKSHRFESPFDPKLKSYNCQDTHNTLISGANLARCILRDHGHSTAKLSPLTLRFYSDLIWSVVEMCESGIAMSTASLLALESKLQSRMAVLEAEASDSDLLLHGKGVIKSQAAVLSKIIRTLDGVPEPCPENPVVEANAESPLHPSPQPSSSQSTLFSSDSPTTAPAPKSSTAPTSSASTTSLARSHASVLDHHLLKLTPKKKAVSFSTDNRRLFRALLRDSVDPRAEPLRRLLDIASEHSEASKLISSYIKPLLYHGSRGDDDVRSRLLGTDPGMAYPSVFVVPGAYKDSGDEGGQLQGRISVKNPAAQTFPPDIKACLTSRYDGGSIISLDLSQAELRVAGIFSGDPYFVLEYQKPKPDLHGTMAISAMGPDIVTDPGWRSGDRRDDPRQWGKELNFWNLYRGGIRQGQATLLKRTGRIFSWDFFKQVADARPYRTPLLWAWQEELLYAAEKTGIITLPIYGISRYFTGFRRAARPSDEEGKSLMNEIVNFPIQWFAAATTHRIMHFVLQYIRNIRGIRFILHVHDALYFDVAPGMETALDDAITRAVTHVANNDIWARLCEHTGFHIPLVHEMTVKHVAHKETPLPSAA